MLYITIWFIPIFLKKKQLLVFSSLIETLTIYVYYTIFEMFASESLKAP